MILLASASMLCLMFISAWIFVSSKETWMKVLAFSSLSIKGPIFIILWGCLTKSYGSTVVAVTLLILGNLSIFLLSIFLERRNPV